MVDGQSRRTFNILKGLSVDFDVYLLALYEDQESEFIESPELLQYCSDAEFLPCPSKKVSFEMLTRLFRSFLSLLPYTVWRHQSRRFKTRLDELLSETDFDLIHCDCLPLAALVKKNSQIPVTLTDHDISYQKADRIAANSKNIFLKSFMALEAVKLKRFERTIFTCFDSVIAVSENDRDAFVDLCPGATVEIIENGVDTSEFLPGKFDTEGFTLVWLGGFGHYPNLEAILYFLREIYAEVKKQVASVRLVAIGGGVTEELKRYSDQDPSVQFLGFVEDPLPIIETSNVFISPILSGGGTKLKVLEAMALGKPIVTTPVGAEGIDGRSGEHFIVADGAEPFAESVCEILNDRSLQKKLAEKARELAEEKYDWSRICHKNNRYYSTLIDLFRTRAR